MKKFESIGYIFVIVALIALNLISLVLHERQQDRHSFKHFHHKEYKNSPQSSQKSDTQTTRKIDELFPIEIPKLNTYPETSMGTSGERIDNSATRQALYEEEAFCKISSGVILSTHLRKRNIDPCEEIDLSLLSELELETPAGFITVYGSIPGDNMRCQQMEGATYYAYFLPERWRMVGNMAYNIVVNKDFFVLDARDFEKELPECKTP